MRAPTQDELKAMVLQALRDRNPPMYLELEEAGALDSFAEERAKNMEETADELETPELFRLAKSNLGHLERLQAATSVHRQAWEQSFQTWLEFPPNPLDPDRITASELEG